MHSRQLYPCVQAHHTPSHHPFLHIHLLPHLQRTLNLKSLSFGLLTTGQLQHMEPVISPSSRLTSLALLLVIKFWLLRRLIWRFSRQPTLSMDLSCQTLAKRVSTPWFTSFLLMSSQLVRDFKPPTSSSPGSKYWNNVILRNPRRSFLQWANFSTASLPACLQDFTSSTNRSVSRSWPRTQFGSVHRSWYDYNYSFARSSGRWRVLLGSIWPVSLEWGDWEGEKDSAPWDAETTEGSHPGTHSFPVCNKCMLSLMPISQSITSEKQISIS